MEGFYGDDAPIAAFATQPGKSPLTLIRLSGKGSIEAFAHVFSPAAKLLAAPGNRVLHGWIVADGEKIDEVLVSVFRAPKSYTGEDSLDISCHGGGATGGAVMAALKSAGFRDALAGEFTFRAFLAGKLDLTRCESVMELVAAKTDAARRGAVGRLAGVLEAEIEGIKKTLVEVLAACEIFLDYSQDEVGADEAEVAGLMPAQDKAAAAAARLKSLAASWQRQRIYQEGLLAVIAGRPNAGKSSLFNLLLKEERSIVTETPGTTRDWIEAWVSVEGVPLRLVDTAGLRESDEAAEKIGIERSRLLLEEAEIIIYIVDGAADSIEAAREAAREAALFLEGEGRLRPVLFVWNKADIAPMPGEFSPGGQPPVAISAKTGEGLSQLCAAIAAA
ncbi:MAG: tRNA uridine-5-carboxymethylaminomethyl(34) synthesis GTPase MnmE, partial [Spirochaetes bacterium]|nr:tRNA uridine-5-carboxymethylaminomethyl(34) synthesis GTPase MnmE [Spirochaetota bacterium]